MDYRLLITGASGFFGNSCLPFLKGGNFETIALYNQGPKPHQTSGPKIEWRQLDLFNQDARRKLVEDFQPTHLLHLAWIVTPKLFWTSLDNIKWLHLTCDLFQEFLAIGGQYFVGAGTLAEYGWSEEELDEETTLCKPTTLYGQSKLSTFQLLEKIRLQDNSSMCLSWARLGYFFGENGPPEKLIPTLIRQMKKGEPINLLQRDDITRDYAHVRYAGKTLTELIRKPIPGLINIGSGHTTRLGTMVEYIAEALNYNQPINYGTYKTSTSEPQTWVPNVRRMEEELHLKFDNTLKEDLLEITKI